MNKNWYSYKDYSVVRGGDLRLRIYWTAGFKDALVKFDNVEIGEINSLKSVKEGRSFQLPDGSTLLVKYGVHPVVGGPAPDLTLNGNPVPGSLKDPAFELKLAANAFKWGGILTIFAALVYSSANPGWWYTLSSIIIGILGLIVGSSISKMSRSALRFGVVLAIWFAITYLLGFAFSSDGTMDFLGQILSFVDAALFVIGLVKGFPAMNALNKEGVKSI